MDSKSNLSSLPLTRSTWSLNITSGVYHIGVRNGCPDEGARSPPAPRAQAPRLVDKPRYTHRMSYQCIRDLAESRLPIQSRRAVQSAEGVLGIGLVSGPDKLEKRHEN